jgi:hypothetical protein
VSDVNELAASTLRAAIENLENALKSGEGNLVNEFQLKGELSNKLAQLAEVSQRHEVLEKEKREDKVRELAIGSYLVEKETKLNAQEKAQYAEFLKLDYFTKADFGRLETFYENSWDKLSDTGKSAMSQRLWEGIHRGNYTFDELPSVVQERDKEWLYLQATGQQKPDPWFEKVSETDKADFRQAYEAKDDKAVSEVLRRDGFSQQVPVEKSASIEADFHKENESDGKEAVNQVVKESSGEFGTLAAVLDDDTPALKPTDLKSGGSLSRA